MDEQVSRVHDPIAASRRIALRAVLVQATAVAVLALACLAWGPRPALAALVGGWSLALGQGLAASMALGGIVRAQVAFSRLLLGSMAKWSVAMFVFAAGLVAWRLPPLPMLSGLVVASLAYLVALQVLAVHGKSSQALKG